MNTKNLKPFDLEAALKGDPVMLRDGSRAFVRQYKSGADTDSKFALTGVAECRSYYPTWTKEGYFNGRDREIDIIGMYPKTRIINGFEVPEPETKEPNVGSVYYIPMLHYSDYYTSNRWSGGAFEIELRLKRDLVFLRKEDAIANAKAMLGIDPLCLERSLYEKL